MYDKMFILSPFVGKKKEWKIRLKKKITPDLILVILTQWSD